VKNFLTTVRDKLNADWGVKELHVIWLSLDNQSRLFEKFWNSFFLGHFRYLCLARTPYS
jgi:hypothetical protein